MARISGIKPSPSAYRNHAKNLCSFSVTRSSLICQCLPPCSSFSLKSSNVLWHSDPTIHMNYKLAFGWCSSQLFESQEQWDVSSMMATYSLCNRNSPIRRGWKSWWKIKHGESCQQGPWYISINKMGWLCNIKRSGSLEGKGRWLSQGLLG